MRKILILISLWSAFVYADDAAILQDKLNAMRSMSAQFSQVVKAEKRQVSSSTGIMALNRPGRFRWDTQSPMAQLVVADGKRLWIYDVDLEQVSVKKQDKSVGGTAGLFLSGTGNMVSQDFTVTQQMQGNTQSFDLHSKSSRANFQRVQMSFENNLLKTLVLYDQLGQKTEVKFSKIKLNAALSPSLFQFKPPKGVDVVEQ